MLEIIVIFVLGLCLGSFVNALVFRLHKQSEKSPVTSHQSPANKKSKLATSDRRQTTDYSIVRGRSRCVHCSHELAWQDLVPVLSWLTLGGKCRYCHKPISPEYPAVELLTAVLFVVSYLAWPPIFHLPSSIFLFALWLALLTILIALAIYDLKYMLLPNRLVFLAGIVTAIYVLFSAVSDTSLQPIIGAALGGLSFGGLFYVLYKLSAGKWIGGGDVKLGFVLGAWLMSIPLSLLAIFGASITGSLIAGVLMLSGRANLKSRLPFGPMLIAGTFLAALYGQAIIRAYTNFVLGV